MLLVSSRSLLWASKTHGMTAVVSKRLVRSGYIYSSSRLLSCLVSSKPLHHHTDSHSRFLSSTSAATAADASNSDGPWGDLFQAEVGLDLMGKTANIRRTFDARSNALGLLTCGGEALAAHASFDPEYGRAREWIQHHAVGPAVLSPVLISGLVGALVEAAFPQSVGMASSMEQIRPLIVGVEVCATIEVVSVSDSEVASEEAAASCGGQSDKREDIYEKKDGFKVCLRTKVDRVRDGASIAQGTHSIWIPDYLHM